MSSTVLATVLFIVIILADFYTNYKVRKSKKEIEDIVHQQNKRLLQYERLSRIKEFEYQTLLLSYINAEIIISEKEEKFERCSELIAKREQVQYDLLKLKSELI